MKCPVCVYIYIYIYCRTEMDVYVTFNCISLYLQTLILSTV